MKNLHAILMIILFSQLSQAQNNYNELWKQVTQFEKEGLPKSALGIISDITKQAKEDKNNPQIIKALLYKSKYVLTLEEDAQLHIINDFKDEINTSTFPQKNILENILANLYWQYFNQNRWKFYNRTKTETKVDKEDFRTWDLQTLFNEIHLNYQNSLQEGLLLQQEQLSDFDVILTLQEKSKQFRPTLFDFLSHNALAFYKTTENSINKPAYKFEIDDPNLLNDAKTFSSLNITSSDSTSLQLHALKIYQTLITFHLKDKSPIALTNVNIERLLFVKQHVTFNDKDNKLLKTLKEESNSTLPHKVSSLYDFEIASIYHQHGLTYKPKEKEEYRWSIKESLDLCNTIIDKFPKSKGAEKCNLLKQQIRLPDLQITSEDVLPIQENSRLLIRYKNTKTLHFTIYTLTENQFGKLNKTYRKEDQLALIKRLKSIKQWTSSLRDENDYQSHTTEILLPKLYNGRYVVLAAPNENHTTFAFKPIQITNFALVESDDILQKTFQVINRNNGKPIANATLNISYIKNYNRDGRISKQLTTNNKGQAFLEKENGSRFRDIKVEIIHQNEKAYFGSYYLNASGNNYSNQKPNYKIFLFTDRSIYRPGQVVYFKGIALKQESNTSQLVTNETVFATLHDVNGQKITELDFETNDYGSFHGQFILPNGGLTGQYYIETYSSISGKHNHYFKVEEYKRPKFQTQFKPITETFKVNDSIIIYGEALAYAGSNITNAKVVYRVKRKVQYPRWYYWYRPWFNSEPQEIAHGESVTDASGNFEIKFKALPDQSVDKNNLPVFNYEITADVTDINGETRSATTIVNVGYHALTAKMTLDETLDKNNKEHKITIETKNLNGEFVAAKGTIKIYKLKAPQRLLRKRPWQAPDYQEWANTEFIKLFPHDAYTNEDQSNNWEKGALVFEKRFNTKVSKEMALGNIKTWSSGKYIIILESKDKFGQVVKDELRTTLFSKKDKTLADKQRFSIIANKDHYTTNDEVILTLASAAKDITVTVDVEKNNQITNTYLIHLNNNKKIVQITVNQDDLGGFVVHYSLATYNDFISGTKTINVPYPKTDLEIETLTFRDKLQPGTDETWQFKVKGPKGDKVAAELLASMYDASLDQFTTHNWTFNPLLKPSYRSYSKKTAIRSFGVNKFRIRNERYNTISYPQQSYDQLNWFGFYFGNSGNYFTKSLSGRVAGVQVEENLMMVAEDAELDEVVVALNDKTEVDQIGSTGDVPEEDHTNFDNIQIRKNLQETAFFFPQLQTDKDGHVYFSFTTPEALTQWKLQLLAHTKTLESAVTALETVTQKELMVIPNTPRFLRQGDQITISTKIANISNNNLSGEATLKLYDALTGNEITGKIVRSNAIETFTVASKENTQVSWQLTIPDTVQAIQYKVIAKAGLFSDGEQNALPVLTNRMLVTETMPMWIKSNQTKTFTLDKLKNTTSSTLKHHKLSLEMTSNPAWYAVQALPYLMEYPYDCNEQIFSRYYANALASHIANSNPRIKEVFNQWKNTNALLSNLEKNEELKSLLIQETPWLRDAQSETEQKKRIALLFDLNKMNNELQSALQKLKNNQINNGSWSWFRGGPGNRYITQHIITGFGHLKQLNVIDFSSEAQLGDLTQITKKAITYLDAEFVKEYNNIRKYNKDVDLNKDHLSYTQLHYLYMRSFFSGFKMSSEVKNIRDYYHTQIKKYWLSRSLYAKGLMVLITHRLDDRETTTKILKSLKENSIISEELGMYWKSNTNSWYWHQAPIETQALLIEAFSEIENDTKTIDNLKIWLLKNKQTNQWKTTKATTEAVYALLLQGSDWLSVTEMVDVALGGNNISPSKLEDVKIEAGTGYFKTSWKTTEIKPEMAQVELTKKGKGIAWGSLYWQYFENLDKITSAKTPLLLNKKLFIKKNIDRGEQIIEITKDSELKVGDLIRVRIELKADRSMEFVHMKDMRASSLEPINVISQYKWQDGLGYYESTKDAATNFFFDYLPKGIYVFEYDLRVNNAGHFSNGITTIQSMYAPEFSSHSEGVRITVR